MASASRREKALESLLEGDPEKSRRDPRLSLGYWRWPRLQQNDAKGAEEVFQKACEQSSTPADAMIYLGDFYLSQHRTADAEQQFQRALSTDPQSGAALFKLAKQSAQGRAPEAEESLKRLSTLAGFKHM